MVSLGLRGRSIVVSIAIFLIVGLTSLTFIYQFARSMSFTLGKEYTSEHALRYSDKLSDMLGFNIRLAEKISSSRLLTSWLLNEEDEEAKVRALKMMNDSVSISLADSWFVAFEESGHYYFDDKINSYQGKERVKKLSIDTSDDAWFYHTLRSAKPYNLNIDYDSAVNATKLWLNMPVRFEGKVLAVIGFGIDYQAFIDAYVATHKDSFDAMILNLKGAILGSNHATQMTQKIHTSDPASWRTIWPLLDNPSQECLQKILQTLPYGKTKTMTTELKVEGKQYIAAVSYLPHLDWVALSMVNTEAIFSLHEMTSSFLIFLMLATLTAIGTYWMAHRYLLKPIVNLSMIAKAVSKGDYKKRVDANMERKDELSTLCVLVNEMIDKVEDATESALERYRWLAENSHDVIWVMDLHGKFIYVSPSVQRLRGFSAEEVMAQPFEEVICESSRHAVLQSMEEAVLEAQRGNTPKAKTLLVEQPCKDGSTVWTEVNARLVINLKDSSMQFIGVTRDITERLVAEEEIKKLAFYDPLTHLANRRLLLDRLESQLFTCKRKHCFGSVVFLDLDYFKPLNDTHGHQLGDELLVEVGKRLKASIRASDTAGRFGGDEFVVLLSELGDSKEDARQMATTIANKIGAALAQPYVLSTVTYTLSASIGVVLFGENDSDAKAILDEADSVMYQAKESGKECVVVKGRFI